MTIDVKNLVVLVTGAAGGIGRAICRALSDSGATVIATDLAKTADVPGSHEYYPHDVTSEADWARMAQRIKSSHGRLDALVNNAAVAQVESIEATSLAAWRKIQSVNVESILLGTQAMLELLKIGGKTRKGGASIVNFSSVGGLRGAAFTSAYCTSKGAVKLFTKSAAIEFGALRYGIRVNSVHPGGIETEMLGGMIQRYVDFGAVPSVEAAQAGIVAQHPIGRLGTPEEIGEGVVYLCSSASSFVTGAEFVIDGGFTCV